MLWIVLYAMVSMYGTRKLYRSDKEKYKRLPLLYVVFHIGIAAIYKIYQLRKDVPIVEENALRDFAMSQVSMSEQGSVPSTPSSGLSSDVFSEVGA